MLVRVNQPRINEFIIAGTLSETFLEALIREFGSDLSVEDQDDDEEYVNIKETEWYRQMDATESAGENLRFYRNLNHMTQAEVATVLSTTRQHVSDMEHDRKPISRKSAKALSQLFHVSVSRFI